MKDNLEEVFKNRLEGYEAPYDPAAWNALNAKLGATAKGGAASGITKWLLIGASVGAAAIAAYFFIGDDKETAKEQIVQIQEVEEQKQETTVETLETTKESKEVEKIEETTVEEIPAHELNSQEIAPKTLPGEYEATTPVEVPYKEVEQSNDNIRPQEPTVKEPVFIKGELSTTEICLGDRVQIQNPGTKDEMVHWYVQEENDGGVYGVLEAGEMMTYQPQGTTTVEFKDEAGNVLSRTMVKVNGKPSAEFGFEANIYEKGLPVVNVEAYGPAEYSYQWQFANEMKNNGVKASHHFFEKGEYDITLVVTDRNGCVNEISQKVTIREKFNLMAVDAFKPNGADPRNRTFMPYSLTERGAKFTLTIIDPMTNEVVFESSRADNAWNGVNQRTGKMTASEKAYVWKVQILDPLPNERPIYTGTVIHD